MESENQKQKILFIITKSNFGGAQRYVYDLATNLPKNEFETSVALGGSGILKDKLEAEGITTHTLSGLERDIAFFKEIRAFFNILRLIRITRPNFVHLNSSKAGILGALAVRFYDFFLRLSTFDFKLSTCKVLFTAHGWAFKEKRKPIAKKVIEYLSWLTIALSHKTIVVSKDDKEKVAKFLFIQPKIVLIHNGISSPIFKTREESRKTLSGQIGKEISQKNLWIGSISELHKNKGIEHAVNAFALIKRQEVASNKNFGDFSYIIIGEGEERKNLELQIGAEGLGNTVMLAGQYNGASELLKAFDIFLLPSLKEGLPYALLEAGYASLPIIATNVGGISEVIDDMKSGIVIKEKRPKEIADALIFLLSNAEKRKEFGERILETVRKEYTLERMLRETIAVYENC